MAATATPATAAQVGRLVGKRFKAIPLPSPRQREPFPRNLAARYEDHVKGSCQSGFSGSPLCVLHTDAIIMILAGRRGEPAVAGKRVLIVEDDRHIVDLLRLYLEHEGYQVLKAYDGLSGLEQARTQQ